MKAQRSPKSPLIFMKFAENLVLGPPVIFQRVSTETETIFFFFFFFWGGGVLEIAERCDRSMVSLLWKGAVYNFWEPPIYSERDSRSLYMHIFALRLSCTLWNKI